MALSYPRPCGFCLVSFKKIKWKKKKQTKKIYKKNLKIKLNKTKRKWKQIEQSKKIKQK